MIWFASTFYFAGLRTYWEGFGDDRVDLQNLRERSRERPHAWIQRGQNCEPALWAD